MLLVIVLAGCTHPPVVLPGATETIQGVVVEKRANVKSYESWNSPSDPYYILDMGNASERYIDGTNTWQQTRNRHVTLRPSEDVTTEELKKLKGKQVVVTGCRTEGKPYKPSNQFEQYPMEPEIITKSDGTPELGPMRPANHGSGFIVKSIKEELK